MDAKLVGQTDPLDPNPVLLSEVLERMDLALDAASGSFPLAQLFNDWKRGVAVDSDRWLKTTTSVFVECAVRLGEESSAERLTKALDALYHALHAYDQKKWPSVRNFFGIFDEVIVKIRT